MIAGCDAVPTPTCLSVVVLRQKIYRSTILDQHVGCVIVGGIKIGSDQYVSFGINFTLDDSNSWQVHSIHRNRSLNDELTLSDVMHHTCLK
jgi:hypothetical protein